MQPKGFIGILPLFAIIAVLVATVGGGAYYLTHKTPAAQSPFYEPVSNTQTTVFAAPAQTPSAGSDISVPGMSKYTDADFGFSFWYPSGWSSPTPVPASTAEGAIGILPMQGGRVVKTLQLKTDGPNSLYIQEIDSSAGLLFNAGNGYVFTFNIGAQQWMNEDLLTKKSSAMDMSQKTMGGLYLLYYGAFVPLGTEKFIAVGSNNGNNPYGEVLPITPFDKTIMATDPAVATPVSAAEQIKIIQAEKDAYTQ